MTHFKPSKDELRAVQGALKSRNVHLEDHFITIQTFLHLTGDPTEGPPTPESDGRRELVDRCGQLADELRKVREAVGAVNFNPDAKKALRASLAASAKCWDARAEIFGTLDIGRIQRAQKVAEEATDKAAGYAPSLNPYFVAP
jgi:hypothetical protein